MKQEYLDTLIVENFTCAGNVGVSRHEERHPQPLRFDMRITYDTAKAIETEDFAHVINYKAVCNDIRGHLREKSYRLIETLGHDLATMIIDKYGARDVTLNLIKPNAMRDASQTGIEVRRSAK